MGGNCTCPVGESACGGTCVNDQTDPTHCGEACTACVAGATCTSGVCGCPATAPLLCSSGCVNEQTDPNNCGGCATTPPLMGETCQGGAYACPVGETACGTACANTQTDANNCGGCRISCGGTCSYGRCLVTLASGQNPRSIATDGTNVYWANAGTNGTLMKCAVGGCGGAPTMLATTAQSLGSAIALDGTSVYWANDGPPNGGAYGMSAVMSVPLGGGTLVTIASGRDQPYGIAVNGANVYWTDSVDGTVMKCPVGGCGGGSLAVECVNAVGHTSCTFYLGDYSPWAIAVDATSVYWTSPIGDNVSSTVVKCALGGCSGPGPLGTPVVLASGQTDYDSVAVDSTTVYWGAQAPSGGVMSVPLGGGTPNTLAPGYTGQNSIAADGTTVYWAGGGNGMNGTVMKVPIGGLPDGGAPTTLATGQAALGIAVDATSVYWANGGTIVKLTPK